MTYQGTCTRCGERAETKWPKPLTQYEADQMATAACQHPGPDCIISRLGVCRYCGQTIMINCRTSTTPEELEAMAVRRCKCTQAGIATERERQVERASERIRQLFGDEAEYIDVLPIRQDVISELYNVVRIISEHGMLSAVIKVDATITAKIKANAKGIIVVERVETQKYSLEE